jgi:hypothetical protein
MAAIRAGETWKILLGDEIRRVIVLAAADTPGWWHCVDLQTSMHIMAREEWFVEREQPDEQP